jgi:hypothetical protein
VVGVGRTAFAAAALAVGTALSACSAKVGVDVAVARGSVGSVTVSLVLPSRVAAEAEAYKVGFVTGDLKRAGWVVEGPTSGPGGTVALSAAHGFSSLAEASALVADIAGTGPAAGRPFRLVLSEDKGTLADRYRAVGTMDLRCGLSCFGDPRLAKSVGYALGLPPPVLRSFLGASGEVPVGFGFVLRLPGKLEAATATPPVTVESAGDIAGRQGTTLEWSGLLGHETVIGATTRAVDLTLLRHLVVALSAGALLVLATAASLLVRRRRRRPKLGGGGSSGCR